MAFQLSTSARSTVYIAPQFPATGLNFNESEDGSGLTKKGRTRNSLHEKHDATLSPQDQNPIQSKTTRRKSTKRAAGRRMMSQTTGHSSRALRYSTLIPPSAKTRTTTAVHERKQAPCLLEPRSSPPTVGRLVSTEHTCLLMAPLDWNKCESQTIHTGLTNVT